MASSDKIIPIFIGYDERQPIAYTALVQSIIENTSVPVAITPLILRTLPVKRQGLTPFTFSRFLIPHLMHYLGWALFLDIDIMVRGDIADLWKLRDEKCGAMIVRHEGALKFERASVMLLNCHMCGVLTPDYVASAENLHSLSWLPENEIGALPKEWNHLVGYDTPNPDAKIVHFTQGIPAFPETKDSEFAGEWSASMKRAASSMPWITLMGPSVHARPVLDRLTATRHRHAG